MKLIKNSIYALSMVSLMGLWSCSSDEMLSGGSDTQGHPVTLTLTVNRSDAQTRTELSENEMAGLTSVWESGDKLYVYNENGKEIGALSLTDGAASSVGIFEGTVSADPGEQELRVWYHNKEKAGSYFSFVEGSSKTTLKILLNEQSFKSASDLAAVEVMGQTVKVNVNGNVASVVENTTMSPKLAMAKFSLTGLPSGSVGDLRIFEAQKKESGTEASTLNVLELDLRRPMGQPGASNTGTLQDKKYGINVRNISAADDIYVALIPRSAATRYYFEFTTSDNKVYSYKFENATLIKAGTYYNAGIENGKIKGIEIPLVEDKPEVEVRLNANFADAAISEIVVTGDGSNYDLTQAYLSNVDKDSNKTLSVPSNGYTFVGWSKDSTGKGTFEKSASLTESATYYAIWAKNPLYKWAEGDLVYDRDSKTSSVAASYTVQGSLYQWGRNIGWSNHEDAKYLLGLLGNAVWSYATYGRSYNSGTGFNGNTINVEGSIGYSTLDELKTYKGMFFMNPKGTDYWDSAFGNGGSDWASRAKKCGWDGEPCPSGYRMPKKADFKELMPSEVYIGDGSLAQILNKTEIKTYNEKESLKEYVSVAWRWTGEKIGQRNYLRIDACVVDINTVDAAEIDWSDKARVQTRYFGANGGIVAFYHENIVGNGTSTQTFPVARPMPGTHLRYDEIKTKTSGWNTYNCVVWNSITDLSVNNEGYYWVSDANITVQFANNEAAKNQRGFNSNGVLGAGDYVYADMKSILTSVYMNQQNACSIRCINTEREKE